MYTCTYTYVYSSLMRLHNSVGARAFIVEVSLKFNHLLMIPSVYGLFLVG